MKAILTSLCIAEAMPASAQTAPPPAADAWAPLAFLEGAWGAKATRPDGVAVDASYLFRRELRGHVMARRAASNAACTGPATFDCEHSDELIVYEEQPGQPLKAPVRRQRGTRHPLRGVDARAERRGVSFGRRQWPALPPRIQARPWRDAAGKFQDPDGRDMSDWRRTSSGRPRPARPRAVQAGTTRPGASPSAAPGLTVPQFQIQMPGQSDWRSYLEWSGPKR